MDEIIPTTSPRETLNNHRFIKELGNVERVTLAGNVGKELEEILDRTDDEMRMLEDKNSSWIQDKRRLLGDYLQNSTEEELRTAYEHGIHNFIKLEYRVFKTTSPSELDKLKDNTYLDGIIRSYTFDFYLSLRTSQRYHVSPNQALELAKLSYRHDPQEMVRLMIEFPDFTPSDIRHALLHNPLDPKGLLKKTEEAVEKYKGQFPIFRENELRNIILGRPTNPERALAELDDSIRNLQDRFPLFPGFQIKRIVINNGVKNAPSEIERVIELSNRLSGLYPEFSISDIQSVAIDNKDPDTFLQNARSKVIGMQKKFPEISHSLLIKACIDHPDSTESFLREVEKVTKELISIFPDLNEGEIRYVAVRNPKTARDNLSVDLVRIKQLQADHAEIPPWLARRAAIFYRNNPEEFIERVKRRVQELKETNSGKPRWALYEAAVRHVSDPQTFLDNI